MMSKTAIAVCEERQPKSSAGEILTLFDRISRRWKDWKGYESWSQLLNDIQLIQNDFRATCRLVTFFKPELINIVTYPIYTIHSKSPRWNYNCLDDYEDVEACVLEGLWQVARKIQLDPSIIARKSLDEIRKKIAKRVRFSVKDDIYRALGISSHFTIDKKSGKKIYEKKVIYMSDVGRLLERNSTKEKYPGKVIFTPSEKATTVPINLKQKQFLGPETVTLRKEKKKLIESVIGEFLDGLDKLNAMIFMNFLSMKMQYENYEIEKMTEKRIAMICGVSEITVVRKKKRIIKEFQKIWNEKVAPYIEN